MTTAKAKFKCPDCDKEFASANAIGPHRNKAHGYKVEKPRKPKSGRFDVSFPCQFCAFVAKWKGGLTKHIRAKHPEDAEPKKVAQAIPGPPYICPECSRSYAATRGLGIHRRQAHGVIGAAKTTIRQRQRELKLKGTELAKTTQDVATHRAVNAHIEVPTRTEDDRASHRLEAAATYAAGRVAQLLQGIASEYDLPSRAFTSLVIRTLGRTT